MCFSFVLSLLGKLYWILWMAASIEYVKRYYPSSPAFRSGVHLAVLLVGFYMIVLGGRDQFVVVAVMDLLFFSAELGGGSNVSCLIVFARWCILLLIN